MQSNMDAEQTSNSTIQSPTEHLSESLIKQDKHYTSQHSKTHEDDQPRKRSRSVLQWVQKTITNATSSHGHHDKSYTRERSATTSTPPPAKPSLSRGRPPVNQVFTNDSRQRSSTMDSVTSTGKKVHQPKTKIWDTDPKAQQSPSIFQYFLGR
ncbi:hypothetical protein I4U23_028268 [Adineta vaga]|nr:hypothetical protein I4U23_028268 [Adineta vaga]